MSGITRTFPGGVIANDGVSLTVQPGTIHAVIGENGAGKSTLMNVLYGRIQPDRGQIWVRGEEARIASPADAIRLGIGMVSQHTALIPALTALDNVILGAEPSSAGIIDRRKAREKVRELAGRLGVQVDWDAPVAAQSVAACQKTEIVKALYRGASILILDEPTATLAPQEANALFTLLHALAASGATILFITHKLEEVLAHSERVTVLRAGRNAGERETADTCAPDLLALMLGEREVPDEVEIPAPDPSAQTGAAPALEVRNLSVLNDRRAPAVRGVTLEVHPGEVVGVAGVDGSGQRELAEAIVGLRTPAEGQVFLGGEAMTRRSVAYRRERGLGFIPEDRQREGLVLDFTLAENLLLGRERERGSGGGMLLNLRRVAALGEEAIARSRIRAPGPAVKARALSGGNQQKVVVARALSGEPKVLVAMQPTRGLDVEAARQVYAALREAQARGLAILLLSLDLDEVLALSDRVAVMYNGALAGIFPRAEATAEVVGARMVGAGTG